MPKHPGKPPNVESTGWTSGSSKPDRPHLLGLARADGGAHHGAHDGDILSPMPGRIIAVEVSEGQAVSKGQKLLTLEAMKMEHTLTAPFDGVVAQLAASPGAQVQVEALLARIESKEG